MVGVIPGTIQPVIPDLIRNLFTREILKPVQDDTFVATRHSGHNPTCHSGPDPESLYKRDPETSSG